MGTGGRIFTERKRLNKSIEIFHAFVCMSFTMSFHVISHKSLDDYFLGPAVTRCDVVCWGYS
jgi:hypothetical protein